MRKKDVLAINITILALALLIVLYPYIAPYLYKFFPRFWGDPTEKVTGIPSAYHGITADVRNFNYAITHFSKITFINKSAYIVIFTTWGNIIYRIIYLFNFKKIKTYKKILIIDLSINFILVMFFWYNAFSLWYQNYLNSR